MIKHTFENFKEKALSNPKVKAEYDKLKSTQQLRVKLIKIRKEAGLTIEEVAKRMHTHKANISRFESVEYLELHSPKLITLENYANACGKHLKINFQ